MLCYYANRHVYFMFLSQDSLACCRQLVKTPKSSFAMLTYKGPNTLPWIQVAQKPAGMGASAIYAILGMVDVICSISLIGSYSATSQPTVHSPVQSFYNTTPVTRSSILWQQICIGWWGLKLLTVHRDWNDNRSSHLLLNLFWIYYTYY